MGNRLGLMLGLTACGVVMALAGFWIVWTSFRIDVPEKHCAVLTRRTGMDIPNDAEISPLPKDGWHYKGVQQEVLLEGRYFYNCYNYGWNVIPMFEVPTGKLAVKVRRIGADLPVGQLVARSEDQKGIVSEVLRPGRYAINPHIYDVKLFDPVTVPAGFRGVRTNLSGPMPEDPNVLLVTEGFRGVQEKTYEEGTYYVNPYVERINLVDCRSKRFNLNESGEMGFPSKDGFWVSLDGRLEFRIQPDKAAIVFVTYNDVTNKVGMTDPLDQEIINKVIMPNARSYCRLRGSDNSGRDFIGGSTREAFQTDFSDKMVAACSPQGVEIVQALITRVVPPKRIADPVREREVSLQTLDHYTQEIKLQEAEKSLAISSEMVKRGPAIRAAEQSVTKIVEAANKEQKIALQEANKNFGDAERDLEAAKDKAEAILARGKATAAVIIFNNEALAAGWKEGVTAFNGDGDAYSRMFLLQKVAPGFTGIMVNTAEDSSPLMDIFKELNEQPQK